MTMFIQSNIPVPARASKSGPDQSLARQKIAELTPGQCLTVTTQDEDERRMMAKRLNSTITTVKKVTGNQYTLRSMYGEVNGAVRPVVRVWRTA